METSSELIELYAMVNFIYAFFVHGIWVALINIIIPYALAWDIIKLILGLVFAILQSY